MNVSTYLKSERVRGNRSAAVAAAAAAVVTFGDDRDTCCDFGCSGNGNGNDCGGGESAPAAC